VKFSIYYTPEFEKQLKRLSKKHKSLNRDIAALVKQLEETPTSGTPLGNNCYKIRLAISSKGKGKSGGARIITCVIVADSEVYLADIYDKSEQENISDKRLKELAKQIQG
jgi:mRNA-degrading endonuclease RelE of RelBE toxin-antitoxin system